MRIRSTLATLAALAGLAAPTGAVADPIAGAYVVVGHEVIEGGTHVWDMPVIVTPGATLEIRNATVFLDWVPPVCFHGTAGYCQPTMQINGGTLRVIGSTLDSHSWGIDEGWSGYSVVGIGAVLDLRNSTFRHQETLGTQGPANATSTIIDNTFDWTTTAIQIWRGATAHIAGNLIRNTMYGVVARDASPAIVGNTFTDVRRHFGAVPFGRAIDIQATVVGDKGLQTSPLVSHNVIEETSQAILVLSSWPGFIRENVIRNSTIGITIGAITGSDIIHDDQPTFVGNTLDSNEIQVRAYASGVRRDGSPVHVVVPFHGNSIVGDSCTDVAVNEQLPSGVTMTIDANDNWWGSASGPASDHGDGCPTFQGDVRAERWLDAAP